VATVDQSKTALRPKSIACRWDCCSIEYTVPMIGRFIYGLIRVVPVSETKVLAVELH